MSGLKDNFPGVYADGDGYQVTPDEIDRYEQYVVIKPSQNSDYIGSLAAGTVAGTITLNKTRLDYPRNLVFCVSGATGTAIGGTVAITGKDQFGATATETIVVGSADGGGTTQGSAVFAEISLGTYDPLASDNPGTVQLGVATGTAAGDTTARFGLPSKLGGTTDIKAITWVDGGTVKEHTAEAAADTTFHAFEVDEDVNNSDDYVVLYKPTYNASGAATQANL